LLTFLLCCQKSAVLLVCSLQSTRGCVLRGRMKPPPPDRGPSRSVCVYSVGSTGDSPVPSGDPPGGTEHGIEGNNTVSSHSSYTTTPPGESPGGAGGSPAPPSVNRDSGPRQHSWWKGSGMLQTTSTERRAAGGDRPRSGGSVMRPYCGQAGE